MVSYCTEIEIEAELLFDITTTSTPTTSQVALLITRASEAVDGLTNKAGGSYGADPSEEDVKAATIAFCVAVIKNKWNGNSDINPVAKANEMLVDRAPKTRVGFAFQNTVTTKDYLS